MFWFVAEREINRETYCVYGWDKHLAQHVLVVCIHSLRQSESKWREKKLSFQISDIILILSAYLFKKYSVRCIFFWLSILLSWKSDFFFTNRRVPTKGNNSLWGPWIPFSRLVYVVIKHTDVSVIIWQAVELKNIYFKLRTLTHKCPTCS